MLETGLITALIIGIAFIVIVLVTTLRARLEVGKEFRADQPDLEDEVDAGVFGTASK